MRDDLIMDSEAIKYQKEDSIAILTIISAVDNQHKLDHFADKLNQHCTSIAMNTEIRVIILTGSAESSFSIGQDLFEEVSNARPRAPKLLYSPAEQICILNQPVIAAINSDALGQGLELALACDIRICTETSHLGLHHIKKELIPWDGGTQRLCRLVGRAKAMEMILTGELIDAEEAYRIGLVTKVVSPQELMPVAMDMARDMASKGPISLRYAKESINKGMDVTLEQGLRLEADLYFLLHTTRDRTEGIRAFQDKRKAQFKGS
jgi:enoyl-CoA hydratase/carnithine racemase